MRISPTHRSVLALLLALLLMLSAGGYALPEETPLSLYEGGGMFQGGSFDGPQAIPSDGAQRAHARSAVVRAAPDEQLYQDILAAMAQPDLRQISYVQYGVLSSASVIHVSLAGRGYPSTNAGKDTVYYLYARAVNSNPRYFYYVPNVLYASQNGYLSDLYMIVNADIFDKRDIYEAAIAEMLAEAVPDRAGMCESEIALAVHDYLVLHARYDWDAFWSVNRYRDYPAAFSAYGALIEKKAVCQGLSLAYMDMLSRLNIPCAVVASYSLGHAWNIVYADGYWYHADITRAMPAVSDPDGDGNLLGQVKHDFFMLSDTESRTMHGGGWTSSDGIPSAPLPHAQAGFWKNVDSGMFRIGAYWYYSDGGYDAAVGCASGILRRAAYADAGEAVFGLNAVSFPARLRNSLFVYDYAAGALSVLHPADGTRVSFRGVMPGEMGFGAIAPDGLAVIPAGYLYIANGSAHILCATGALGDADGTGTLDVRDALRCARGISKALDPLAFARGDVNWDGACTDGDAYLICRRITGLLGSLPAA